MASIGSFSNDIKKILKEYGDEVNEALTESIESEAPKIVKDLKKTSPVQKPAKRKKTYAKQWKKKIEKNRLGSVSLTVYNEDYRLVHLLEKGHALRQGGRTEAHPHVAPAQEKAEENIVKELKEKLR